MYVKLSAGRGDGGAMSSRSMVVMAPVTRQQRRPNGAASRNLNVRVPADVLDAAKAAAAEREETLSAAVVAFLRKYAGDAQPGQ